MLGVNDLENCVGCRREAQDRAENNRQRECFGHGESGEGAARTAAPRNESLRRKNQTKACSLADELSSLSSIPKKKCRIDVNLWLRFRALGSERRTNVVDSV